MLNLFSTKTKLYFLTFKDKNDKYTISKVSDHIRKISNNFYLIKEQNKADAGRHYHCLLSAEKTPTKGWFRKGVHMDLQEVGYKTLVGGNRLKKKTNNIPITFTKEELHNATLATSPAETLIIQVEYEQQKLEAKIQKLEKKAATAEHIERILKYMNKDNPKIQYVDYIYYISNKQRKKQEAEVKAEHLLRVAPKEQVNERGGNVLSLPPINNN